jgi:hypothetical protein
MTKPLKAGLPPLPDQIERLPRTEEGWPVPWFVQWFRDENEPGPPGEGYPDFRVIDSQKLISTIRSPAPRCWVCGQTLGKHRVFTIGPMCSINRIISEPPSHRVCAEFSVKACPFLSQPRMRRNTKDLPEGGSVAGVHIERNPGVTALWETLDYRAKFVDNGFLFNIGEPTRVDWWTRGRAATLEEVLEAIGTGYPQLAELARAEGQRAVEELERRRRAVAKFLPAPALEEGERK